MTYKRRNMSKTRCIQAERTPIQSRRANRDEVADVFLERAFLHQVVELNTFLEQLERLLFVVCTWGHGVFLLFFVCGGYKQPNMR
jgi:hypothetical protein